MNFIISLQARQALKIYLDNVDINKDFTNKFCLNENEAMIEFHKNNDIITVSKCIIYNFIIVFNF